MLELLKRDPDKPLEDGGEPDQGNAFSGLALRGVPGNAGILPAATETAAV